MVVLIQIVINVKLAFIWTKQPVIPRANQDFTLYLLNGFVMPALVIVLRVVFLHQIVFLVRQVHFIVHQIFAKPLALLDNLET